MNSILRICFFFFICLACGQASICKNSPSPINLVLADSVTADSSKTVEFHYIKDGGDLDIRLDINLNTVLLSSSPKTFTEYLMLDGVKFKLHKMRLRWGPSATMGSEHSIDGNLFEGEIQLEHVKVNAMDAGPDRVFVAVLCQVDNLTGGGAYVANLIWGLMEREKLTLTHKAEIRYSSGRPDLKDFLTGPFLRYTGGTTIRDCGLTAEWLVFEKPMLVSEEYFKHLRQLTGYDNKPMLTSALKEQATNGNSLIYTYPSPL